MAVELEKAPMMEALCQGQARLGTPIEDMTRDERIASVGPLVIDIVKRWYRGLMTREKCNYDMDDLLAEIWVEIAIKDAMYNPECGKYTTYAAMLTNRKLGEMRNYMRTVHSPKNSSCRMKTGNPDNPTKQKIANSMREPQGLESAGEELNVEGADDTDITEAIRASAKDAMFSLPPLQARIMRMSYGLGPDRRKLPVSAIARAIGVDVEQIRDLKSSADSAIGEAVASRRESFLL